MFYSPILQPANVEGNIDLHKSNPLWVNLACIMSILDDRGVIESFVTKQSLRNNEPYPLLTHSFMDWFESFDFTNWQLVELGSGNSTHYFSQKFKNIISFETNEIFYNFMLKDNLSQNVDLRYISSYNLSKENFESITFNNNTMVLIDCADSRVPIVKNLIAKNIPSLLVLDNSDILPNLVQYILNHGYKEIPFWGLKLTEHFESCTSIFIKDVCCLPSDRIRYHSIGSRKYQSEFDLK